MRKATITIFILVIFLLSVTNSLAQSEDDSLFCLGGFLLYNEEYADPNYIELTITDNATSEQLYFFATTLPPFSVTPLFVNKYVPIASSVTLFDSISGGSGPSTFTYSLEEVIGFADQNLINGSDCESFAFNFGFSDGRVQIDDAGAPAIVYGNAEAGIIVYEAKENAQIILIVNAKDIEDGGIPKTGAIILAQAINPETGYGVIISRLSDGKFQMNTKYSDGKDYIIQWETGSADLDYVSR